MRKLIHGAINIQNPQPVNPKLELEVEPKTVPEANPKPFPPGVRSS